MGRALIKSGGTGGRYEIEIDAGSLGHARILAAYNQYAQYLQTQITLQQAEIDRPVDGLAALAQNGKNAIAEFIRQIIESGAGASLSGGSAGADSIVNQLRAANVQVRFQLEEAQRRVSSLRIERQGIVDYIATLTTVNPKQTKQAWCTTYTEDGAGAVATIDINGAPDLTLIAPNARTWAAADGVMTMPQVMSPAQSFFNLATLPGWQRHLPKYRWGTITGLNYDTDTADVDLAPATSSQQSLPINAVNQLRGIPVQYMSCNAKAFEVGDRAVVEFVGNDWGAGRVIGFLDNPKPCELFTADYYLAGHPAFSGAGMHLYNHQEEFSKKKFWAPVTAPPANGGRHYFEGWSDGSISLSRDDGQVSVSINVVARYVTAPAQIARRQFTNYRQIVTGEGFTGSEGQFHVYFGRIEGRVGLETQAPPGTPGADVVYGPWLHVWGGSWGHSYISAIHLANSEPYYYDYDQPDGPKLWSPALFMSGWPGGLPRVAPALSSSIALELPASGGRTLTLVGTATAPVPSGGASWPSDITTIGDTTASMTEVVFYNVNSATIT